MNNQVLLALLPIALSASQLQTSSSRKQVTTPTAADTALNFALNHTDTEAATFFDHIMSFHENPEEVAERHRLARDLCAPSARLIETMQHIKHINSMYGQSVDQLHTLEQLRALEAMQECEDDECPLSNFELVYGTTGEMLPVLLRFNRALALQESKNIQ